MLIKAATDTQWFQPLFNYPICFIRGRVRFYTKEGKGAATATFPSVIVYLGNNPDGFASAFSEIGAVGFFGTSLAKAWMGNTVVAQGEPLPTSPRAAVATPPNQLAFPLYHHRYPTG